VDSVALKFDGGHFSKILFPRSWTHYKGFETGLDTRFFPKTGPEKAEK